MPTYEVYLGGGTESFIRLSPLIWVFIIRTQTKVLLIQWHDLYQRGKKFLYHFFLFAELLGKRKGVKRDIPLRTRACE